MTVSANDTSVPQGYAAVAVSLSELGARLRICILLRTEPSAGSLVSVRETVEGCAYLGCLLDADDRVHQWLEIWVQALGTIASMPPVVVETLANATIDERWARATAAMECAMPASVVHTGWERRPPVPVWIDPTARMPTHPAEGNSKEYWQPCRDEAVLLAAELPPYGSSLHRYLYLARLGVQSPLIPVTPKAPTNLRTRPLETVLNGRTDLLPLNPAGMMFVRTFDSIGVEALLNLLSGRMESPAGDERLPSDLRLRPDTLQDPQGEDGWVFIGQHGRRGRLLEAFHLKIRIAAGAVSAVRGAVEQTRRPLLNLSSESFRVNLGEPAPGLPRLWTSRILLADGGDALEVPVPGSETRYFIPRPRSGAAIYRPGRTSEATRGSATIRIRQNIADLSDGVVVEGTLVTQERMEVAGSDLVWVRARFDDGPVDFYARIEAEAGLAAGEWRFRSLGQRMDPTLTARFRANEGRPTLSLFEVLPVLSSPCDLYSLAVLTVRIFLVNSSMSLPVALDSAMSLARQIAKQHDNSAPLSLRVRAVFESDRRWLAALGPHRLIWEGLPTEQALDLIPIELWMDMLALIVGMFPGIGPDSMCSDLGSAPQAALHRVFDRAVGELTRLMVRSRSLIVIDWRYNREIHSVIRGFLVGLSPQPQTEAPAVLDRVR